MTVDLMPARTSNPRTDSAAELRFRARAARRGPRVDRLDHRGRPGHLSGGHGAPGAALFFFRGRVVVVGGFKTARAIKTRAAELVRVAFMKSELFDSEHQIVVLGPSIRTAPPGDQRDIPAFWQRFMAGGFLERLPRRAEDEALHAVYCDYESDHTGAYTMVIGVAVDAGAAAEEGMRRVVIPPGRYGRFAAKGPAAEALWSICGTWPVPGRLALGGGMRRTTSGIRWPRWPPWPAARWMGRWWSG